MFVYDELLQNLRTYLWDIIGAANGLLGFSAEVGLTGVKATLYVRRGTLTFPAVALPGVQFHLQYIEPFLHPISGGPPATVHNDFKAARPVQIFATSPGDNPRNGLFGTVAGFTQTNDGRLHLITPNHVISKNGWFGRIADGNDGIYVNGRRVSRSVPGWVEIVPAGNTVDLAEVKLDVNPDPGPLYDPPLKSGVPWVNPPKGTQVVVYTCDGPIFGSLEQETLEGDMDQDFTPLKPKFEKLLLLRLDSPAVDGNSGSLVAAQASDGWQPIGVLTAKTPTNNLAVACRLDLILQKMNPVPNAILTDWPPNP